MYQVLSKQVWESKSTGCYVWMNLVDLSIFLHMKDEQDEVLVDWFDELKSKYSIDVKYICFDNAGKIKPYSNY